MIILDYVNLRESGDYEESYEDRGYKTFNLPQFVSP